jgi:chromosome segregation ATPase
MVGDRYRILELALESLENKKKQLDAEIADITRELRKGASKEAPAPAKVKRVRAAAKRPRFSKEERLRRSQRMKAYWDNWRKKKVHPK